MKVRKGRLAGGVAVIFLLILCGFPRSVQAHILGPVITSPTSGGVLQGTVPITGTSQADGFVSAEVDFAYTGDPTGTWFVISTSYQPVVEDDLASWDTTPITDGDYDPRLRVHLTDGKSVDAIVTGLRVRNTTPVETPTPTAIVLQPTPTPTATSPPTPYPTPTRLPPNPVTVTGGEVTASIACGGAAAVFFLLLLGAYLGMKRR